MLISTTPLHIVCIRVCNGHIHTTGLDLASDLILLKNNSNADNYNKNS